MISQSRKFCDDHRRFRRSQADPSHRNTIALRACKPLMNAHPDATVAPLLLTCHMMRCASHLSLLDILSVQTCDAVDSDNNNGFAACCVGIHVHRASQALLTFGLLQVRQATTTTGCL